MPKIKVNYDKCDGCHTCEIVCSLQHIESTVNPKRSRIRVFESGDQFIPVMAGPYTDAECTTKGITVINNTEYDSCILCRASCPAKTSFKEPDTDIPLKCDFCGEPPDPECIKWCMSGALTLVE